MDAIIDAPAVEEMIGIVSFVFQTHGNVDFLDNIIPEEEKRERAHKKRMNIWASMEFDMRVSIMRFRDW